MKIVLPKTLAEPLTISWKFISVDATEEDIQNALWELINDYETHKLMPRCPSSTKSVRTMLEVTALGAGADKAGAGAYPMIECKKHVGYEYVVLFSIPGSKNLYNWSIKYWFPLSPA